MSEKITATHLSRKAIVYVRQSSAYQVAHNTESRRLQYAMQNRVRELGWSQVEAIDEDLGCSAAGSVARAGFERMVSEVCLGNVGAVAAREVSRFARNSRDWQKLIEVCRVVDTLLIDQEAVYDPRRSNDRLLLGLKGSLNEYELDLLRQRAWEARRAKASRGELVLQVPAGFVKTADGQVEFDADRRVRESIHLVFRKFFELGTARQVLLWFLEQGFQLPVCRRGVAGWETVWRRPTYPLIHRTLTNPVYAGAYAYGKTQVVSEFRNGQPAKTIRRRPRDQWHALIPGDHEGYVSWEDFERIQQMLSQNTLFGDGMTPGAAKRGPALLVGLLRCRRCGRKLIVHYTGRGHDVVRYACSRGHLDNGESRCIHFGGLDVEQAVSRELLRVVQPVAVEAAVRAGQQMASQRDDVQDALQRDLQAARYVAERAERQYDLADPENRLVTEELERRWNAALQQVGQIESRLAEEQLRRQSVVPPAVEDFRQLADDLQSVWNDPETDVRLKKRILRTLVEEVLVDLDEEQGQILVLIHWCGGVHTQLQVRRRRRGQNRTHAAPEIVDAVRLLVRVGTDAQIAGWLNRGGLRTGRGNRWTKERVASFRNKRDIPPYDPEQLPPTDWITLMAAAKELGVSHTTLRHAVERGEIDASHPVAGGPWIFHREALGSLDAKALVNKGNGCRSQGAAPLPGQQDLGFSGT